MILRCIKYDVDSSFICFLFLQKALVEKCQNIVSVEFNEAPHVSDIAFKALSECRLIKIKIEG